MSDPFDLVLARLEGYKLRMNGADRARSCCPAHGGSNASALSIGRGDNGSVLLKCWQGCDVDAIAGALGLEMEQLFPPREAGAAAPRRRRMLTASQALEVIRAEAMLCAVAASNLAQGLPLSDVDRERLLQAASRIEYMVQEVAA